MSLATSNDNMLIFIMLCHYYEIYFAGCHNAECHDTAISEADFTLS